MAGSGRERLSDHLPHPKHCYCSIPMDLLRKWYIKRYIDGIPTLRLMEMADTQKDKEAICAVASFDLDEESLLQMMGDTNRPQHHIIHCREKVRHELELEY
jgi:hypothetical protein